jgi:TetR/AcrR family transcriptional repressor of nem operon
MASNIPHPQHARSRDGRATRDAVVATARRLMHLHGYRATSLDDVLRESGVGKGNFYYYFRSKEELGHAILDDLIREFLEKTLDPCFADADGHSVAQIRCFLGRLVDIQRRANCVGGCALGNLAAELSDMHEGFRSRLHEVFAAWEQRLVTALARGQSLGELDAACDPAALACFLVASLEGAILMAKLTKDIGVMERCVSELGRHLTLYETRPAG